MDVLRILAILLGAVVLYGIATTYQEYILEKFGKNIFSGGVIASLALVEFLFWYAIGFRKLSWDNEVVLILLGTIVVGVVLWNNIKQMGVDHGLLVTLVQVLAAFVILAIMLVLLLLVSESGKKKKRRTSFFRNSIRVEHSRRKGADDC